MYYNSIDHFLTAHEAAVVAIMAAVHQAVGGHYAAMTPEQRAATARNDTAELFAALRTDTFDPAGSRANAQQTARAGIELDDLARLPTMLEPRLHAYFAEQLRDQATLATDLDRRLAHVVTRYRSTITAVKIDTALERMRKA